MIVFRYGILLFALLLSVSVAGFAQTASEGFFIIKQGDYSQPLEPFRQDGSAAIFYNFQNDQSNSGFEVPERSLLALHVDGLTGNVSLVMIHSSPQNPLGGSMSFSIDGLPLTATMDLQDDFTDSYVFSPPTLQASWTWLPEHNDGLVLGNLGTDFEITITPNFISGITEWNYLDGATRIPNTFPSMTEPITIIGTLNSPPVAQFTVSPTTLNRNVSATFDASDSTDTDGTVVQYEWDFNDDGVFEINTTSPTVQHVFDVGGSATVTLRVTDDTGGTSIFRQTFLVADEVVSARRTISTPQTLPGLAFRVTVELNVRADVNGLGLDEILPPGWEVTPIDNAGATFKRSENQWVFPSVLRAGEIRRIVYDVTIRANNTGVGPLPVNLNIQGDVDSAAPAFRTPVFGEDQVEITSCLAIPVALAHMDPSTDVVDLRTDEDLSFDQLQRAVTFWIEEVSVPQTCDALIEIEMLKELAARETLSIPVDQALQSVNFSGGNPFVSRSILTPLPFHQLYLPATGGDRFTVEVEIVADEDYNGFAISENMPESWRLQPVDNDGAVYNPRTREWLFTDRLLKGEIRKIVYEVLVPSDEANSTFSVTGVASSVAPSFQRAIDNDTVVEIVECLAVDVAVAHLNTDNETIDITLSNQINFNQIQVAIAFWLEDQEVVGTCGQVIGFEEIKSLIAYWLTDTPVDEPLGVSFGNNSN